MKRSIIGAIVLLLCSSAFAQYDDPKAAAKKAQEDAWAKATKEKAANDAIVAKQREAEAKKKKADADKKK
jgi:L-lactate permease